MNRPLPSLLIASLLLLPGLVKSQSYSISTPSITSCAGVLYDSGGSSGAGYGPNESFTTTICPVDSGSHISLNFVVFALDQSGAPDALSIFDGSNTNAPSLGTYTGNELQGLVVSPSAGNTSGCLTLTFTSHATSIGNFAATIACSGPCAAPLAAFTTSLPNPATICPGNTIAVNGSSSLAAPGRSIAAYRWFRDGEPFDTTASGTYAFSFPNGGVSSMALQVVDDLGCPSEQFFSQAVLVSPSPDFSGTTAPSQACAGVAIPLNAVTQQAAMTTLNTGCTSPDSARFLPDDIGYPYDIPFVVSAAPSGATITDVSQIGDICVEMEHSFMGDLVISLTCPNGSSVDLHQQGGGGTYLGGAIDTDSNSNPIPGTCWNYCWNANATNGTWVEEIGTNTTPAGTPPNPALNPGTYSSVQPMSNLIGCPMNGTWTLTFVDLWGADNGFLCSACFALAGNTDSTYVAYGPNLGTSSSDSSFWSGTGIVNDPTDATSATAFSNNAGPLDLVYSITDSYGCTYDTTVTVTILDVPIVNAGPDLSLCADSASIAAVSSGPGAPTETFQWTPSNGLSDPNALATSAFPSGDTQYVLTSTIDGPAGCSSTDTVLVMASTAPPVSIAFDGGAQQLCASDIGFDDYTWYQNGMEVSSGASNCLDNADPGAWVCAATDPAGCLSYSDTVLICPMITLTQNTGILVTETGYASYSWSVNGTPLPGFVGPLVTATYNGLYSVTVTTTYGCVMSASLEVTGLLVGVTELDPTALGLSVFPVPNNGTFTAVVQHANANKVQLNVLDMTGRVLHTQLVFAASGEVRIPIALDIASGAYLVEVLDSGERMVQRIVVR